MFNMIKFLVSVLLDFFYTMCVVIGVISLFGIVVYVLIALTSLLL
jgi:hypothetical protein